MTTHITNNQNLQQTCDIGKQTDTGIILSKGSALYLNNDYDDQLNLIRNDGDSGEAKLKIGTQGVTSSYGTFNKYGIGQNTYCTAPVCAWFLGNGVSQGILLPKLTTTQMKAISSPPNGLLIYNTDLKTHCHYVPATSTWYAYNVTAVP